MYPIPLKPKLKEVNVNKIKPELLLMLITMMELIEKYNQLEIDKSSTSIEPKDALLILLDLNLLLDITKN